MHHKIYPFFLCLVSLLLAFVFPVHSQTTDSLSRVKNSVIPSIDTTFIVKDTAAMAKDTTAVGKSKKTKGKTTPTLSPTQIIANKIKLDSLKKHRDSTQVSFFYSAFEKLGALDLHSSDTAITGFQNYDPLYKHDRFYANQGNIGQCYRPLIPFPFFRESGFDYGIHSSDQYLYQNDSVKYFKVVKTFSELSYNQGAKKEQTFHAVFSRNIYRSLNLGFDFKVMSAPGAYTRQKTNHINFVLTAQFFTKDKRYGVIANFTINRLKNYENGGIKYDSLFEQNIETNRAMIPVNLASTQNRVRETGFFMKHYFDLTRHPLTGSDTTDGKRNRIELGRISYSFQYVRQIQNYIDNLQDSLFYKPYEGDSLTLPTTDSLTLVRIVNDLVWSNPSFNKNQRPRIFQMSAGIKQLYVEAKFNGVLDSQAAKNFFIQFIPHAEIDFNPFYNLKLEAKGDYVLGEYNEGDMSLDVKLSTILGRKDKNAGTLSLSGNYALQKPGWFYQQYHGHYNAWDNDFEKQGVISGGFDYSFKFLEAGFNISRISNYVYMDTSRFPEQLNNEFGHLYAYLNGNVNLWRFLIKARLVYQTVQGTTVLRLPAFMGNLELYYTQPLFKGAAVLQPALTFFYNTSYYADQYNPSDRSYYLQDKREIGNYLYMDVYLNLKIQRARLYVAYTHFNASFMSQDYYSTPTYPMPDAAFKFGVAWRFHD